MAVSKPAVVSGTITPDEIGAFLEVEALAKATNSLDATHEVRKGLPVRALRALRAFGYTIEELAHVTGTSPRTVMRQLGARQRRLSVATSDRVVRMARITLLASRVLNPEYVLEWLRAPKIYLGGAVPLDLMDTEEGTQVVAQGLYTIAYGGVA